MVELVHEMDRSLDSISIVVSSGSFLSPFSFSLRPTFGLTNGLEGGLAFLAFSVGCSRRFLTGWYSGRFTGRLNRHLSDTVEPGGVYFPSSQSRLGNPEVQLTDELVATCQEESFSMKLRIVLLKIFYQVHGFGRRMITHHLLAPACE